MRAVCFARTATIEWNEWQIRSMCFLGNSNCEKPIVRRLFVCCSSNCLPSENRFCHQIMCSITQFDGIVLHNNDAGVFHERSQRKDRKKFRQPLDQTAMLVIPTAIASKSNKFFHVAPIEVGLWRFEIHREQVQFNDDNCFLLLPTFCFDVIHFQARRFYSSSSSSFSLHFLFRSSLSRHGKNRSKRNSISK